MNNGLIGDVQCQRELCEKSLMQLINICPSLFICWSFIDDLAANRRKWWMWERNTREMAKMRLGGQTKRRPASQNSSKLNIYNACFPFFFFLFSFFWPTTVQPITTISSTAHTLKALCDWKIIFTAAVTWLLDFFFFFFFFQWSHTSSSSLRMHQWCLFVVADARVQKHSLQTAQNLLQEEVAHAEARSEVKKTNNLNYVRASFLSFLLWEKKQTFIMLPELLWMIPEKPAVWLTTHPLLCNLIPKDMRNIHTVSNLHTSERN